MNIKQIFCFHKYSEQNLIYDIDYYYKIIYGRSIHKLTLYSMKKCKKCGRIKVKKKIKFVVYSIEELHKIVDLVRSHGARRKIL